MLEGKVCCGNKPTSLQVPARNIEVTSNSREHSSPIQNVTPIEVDHLNVAPAGDFGPPLWKTMLSIQVQNFMLVHRIITRKTKLN